MRISQSDEPVTVDRVMDLSIEVMEAAVKIAVGSSTGIERGTIVLRFFGNAEPECNAVIHGLLPWTVIHAPESIAPVVWRVFRR